MKLTFKNYKILKTKDYIKKNHLFFIFNGINKNSTNQVFIEQNLKHVNYNCYKIFNKTTKKILNDSIYRLIKLAINGNTFFVKSKNKKLLMLILTITFELLLFNILLIKFNDKLYSTIQLKRNYCLNYQNNKLLIFQFSLAHLKKKSK